MVVSMTRARGAKVGSGGPGGLLADPAAAELAVPEAVLAAGELVGAAGEEADHLVAEEVEAGAEFGVGAGGVERGLDALAEGGVEVFGRVERHGGLGEVGAVGFADDLDGVAEAGEGGLELVVEAVAALADVVALEVVAVGVGHDAGEVDAVDADGEGDAGGGLGGILGPAADAFAGELVDVAAEAGKEAGGAGEGDAGVFAGDGDLVGGGGERGGEGVGEGVAGFGLAFLEASAGGASAGGASAGGASAGGAGALGDDAGGDEAVDADEEGDGGAGVGGVDDPSLRGGHG